MSKRFHLIYFYWEFKSYDGDGSSGGGGGGGGGCGSGGSVRVAACLGLAHCKGINPLEHTVVSDATGLAIHFNTQSSARRLRHRCRLLVILAFCQ